MTGKLGARPLLPDLSVLKETRESHPNKSRRIVIAVMLNQQPSTYENSRYSGVISKVNFHFILRDCVSLSIEILL